MLRNNGDETFAVIHPFAGVNGLTGFAAADIDGDGVPDVALIDKDGRPHVFTNERLGQYRPRAGLDGRFRAVAVADINNDGLLDFVLLRDNGMVVRVSDKDSGDVVKADPGGSATLVTADFDNNGSLDLLVGDGQIFLGGDGHFRKVASSVVSASAVDVNGDGRLDLVGLDSAGHAIELLNHGSKNYGWQDIRLRAAKASGDQRINSFGIGGEIEIRAGLLTQKQPIARSSFISAWEATRCRRGAHYLAERRGARRIRIEGWPGNFRHAAAEGLVPLAVRVGRNRR